MSTKYPIELREKILKLHLEGGRTIASLTREFNLGQGTIKYWLKARRKECQTNPVVQAENESYAEIKKLHKELLEAKKEISVSCS